MSDNEILLSVLIPAIPDRIYEAMELYCRLDEMFTGEEVEIIMLTDNCKRSIGEKRNDLKNLAKGKYITQIDDDDKVTDNYKLILEKIKEGTEADVISFNQLSVVNGKYSIIEFSLANNNEEYKPNGITKRKPFHVCAWRRGLVQQYNFPFTGYGEDYGWIEQFIDKAASEERINEVLHEYHHDITKSKADND